MTLLKWLLELAAANNSHLALLLIPENLNTFFKKDSNSTLNKDSKGLYKMQKKRSDQDGEDLADNHRLYANTT